MKDRQCIYPQSCSCLIGDTHWTPYREDLNQQETKSARLTVHKKGRPAIKQCIHPPIVKSTMNVTIYTSLRASSMLFVMSGLIYFFIDRNISKLACQKRAKIDV